MPSVLPDPKTHRRSHMHTCAFINMPLQIMWISLSLSLSSNRAKDGGQGEVSGCPHHPVVIKACCMLGRLWTCICVCFYSAKRHTHTHCCSTRGISQPLSKSEIYRVLSQFGVKYLHLDVYTICSPSWSVQDQLRDQLVFGSCSVWLYRPDLTVLCHVI